MCTDVGTVVGYDSATVNGTPSRAHPEICAWNFAPPHHDVTPPALYEQLISKPMEIKAIDHHEFLAVAEGFLELVVRFGQQWLHTRLHIHWGWRLDPAGPREALLHGGPDLAVQCKRAIHGVQKIGAAGPHVFARLGRVSKGSGAVGGRAVVGLHVAGKWEMQWWGTVVCSLLVGQCYGALIWPTYKYASAGRHRLSLSVRRTFRTWPLAGRSRTSASLRPTSGWRRSLARSLKIDAWIFVSCDIDLGHVRGREAKYRRVQWYRNQTS